jgi:hypothetical protein
VDGRQLADFSLVDQPTIGFRLRRFRLSKAGVGPLSTGAPRLRGLLGSSGGGLAPQKEVKDMVHTGLHGLSWGLQRLGIVTAVTVFAVLLAYVALVVVLVAIQAAAAFGQ